MKADSGDIPKRGLGLPICLELELNRVEGGLAEIRGGREISTCVADHCLNNTAYCGPCVCKNKGYEGRYFGA